MTVEEVRQAKQNLKIDVINLLLEFQKVTGVQVTRLNAELSNVLYPNNTLNGYSTLTQYNIDVDLDV